MNIKDRKILIDFGSTYTKVVFVDLDQNTIIARATHPSTVESEKPHNSGRTNQIY